MLWIYSLKPSKCLCFELHTFWWLKPIASHHPMLSIGLLASYNFFTKKIESTKSCFSLVHYQMQKFSYKEVSLDYLLIYFTLHLLGMIFLPCDRILHFQNQVKIIQSTIVLTLSLLMLNNFLNAEPKHIQTIAF